ncbi:MAG TPA: AAA family ATPase, partial [Streptosporangiaceae bacterium]|nr:AAA family ATPase [Streptosporangiaceae bacterium]
MPTPALFGRDSELSAMTDLLTNAGGGRGGSLLVVGEAGLGKSALLTVAARQAGELGLSVVRATGARREARLPFAGLHQLVQPLRRGMNRLPSPLRTALESVFGRSGVSNTEPFLVALATLELLANAAGSRPVVVLADDVHWLDAASREVLSFVSRRVAVEPIAVVLAAREDTECEAVMDDLPQVRLKPLDTSAATALLDATWPGLRAETRGLVLAAAAGNPLALEELPAVGERDPCILAASPTWQLPLTERLERSFTARLPELGDACRTVLLAVASSDGDDLAETLAAAAIIAGRTLEAADLDPAVAAGLVTYGAGKVAFRHPLVRSGIYGAFTAAHKEAMHSALASTLANSPERSVWHRGAAASGPDEALAAEFDAAADRAQSVGALDVAVEALQRAAGVGDSNCREDRLIRAAELGYEMGRPALVEAFVRDIDPGRIDSLQLGRITWVNEMIHPGLHGDGLRFGVVLSSAEEARRTGNIELGLSLLLLAASRCFWGDAGYSLCQQVIDAALQFDVPNNEPTLIGILAYADPVGCSARVAEALTSYWPSAGDDITDRVLGSAAIAVGAFDLAGPFLSRAATTLRDQGRLGHLPRVLCHQAWIAINTADWATALPLAEEAERLAAERSDRVWVAGAHAGALARIAAIRGNPAGVDASATTAARIAIPMGGRFHMTSSQISRGLGSLSLGDYEEAFQQLRRVYDPADATYHHSIGLWGLGDYAEAALHAGHVEEGRELLVRLRPLTDLCAGSAVRHASAHAQALLAADDAETRFGAALTLAVSPWLRARTNLAYGAWLRRQRRAVEARVPLRIARDGFDVIGATPWAARARDELRATGVASGPQAVERRTELTSQELQIAQLAAQGLTNRE